MMTFYKEHGHIQLVDDMTQAERKAVDAVLETVRPCKRKIGDVEETIGLGASGYVHECDETEQDLASVDVLDEDAELGENDVPADFESVYRPETDAPAGEATVTSAIAEDAADEPDVIHASGAGWIEGCRLSADLIGVLKTHQLEAIDLSIRRLNAGEGVLLAHAMGSGKTLTVLTVLHLLVTPQRGHSLLLCPKAVVNQWADEAYKWRDIVDVATFPLESFDAHSVGRTVHLWQQTGGLLIVQYDQFGKLDIPTDDECVIVFDEAHLLKTPGTQLHTAASSLSSSKRIMLTGTPLQNNLDEYYTMCELVAPNLLGASIGEFRQMYATVIERGMLKDSTEEERKEGERTTQVMRWQMDGVMHDVSDAFLKESLPAKTEYCVSIPFPPIAETGNPIVEYGVISDLTRDAKVRVISQLIDHILTHDSKESILVFSNRHDTLHALNNVRPGLLYVGSSGNKRTSVLSEFQDSGGILYVGIKAGGTGLNLARASRVILADVSFNPVFDTQAVARAFRMGQTRPTVVYRVVAANTLEERIYRVNVQKHSMAARIKDDQDVLRLYSREELKTLDAPMSSLATALGTTQIADAALRNLLLGGGKVNPIVVYAHDAFFTDSDAQLSKQDMNMARHEFHRVVAQNPRMLYVDDERQISQMVEPGQLFFKEPYDDQLVPAYPPTFRCDDDDDDNIVLVVGPSHFFELEQRTDDGDWFKLVTSEPDLKTTMPEVTVALGNGTHRFRVRTVIPNSEMVGPWSEESSEIIMV